MFRHRNGVSVSALRHYLLIVLRICVLFCKKHKILVACTIVVVIQFIALVKLTLDYNALYSLVDISFPDTFWHPSSTNSRISIQRSANFILSNETVLILGCGRNVANSLPGFRRNIYKILKLFKDYRIFLGESDSTDTTLLALQKWSEQDARVHVRTYGNLSVTYSRNRIHRIAYCRNDLLNTARKIWLNTSKFLFVMDIDINASPILTVDNFLSNFEYDSRYWAVMTASQTQVYYDVWAVRSSTLTYDCWEVVDPLKHQKIARQIYVYVHTKPIPRDFGLIPVDSAFGGFGVYQTRYLNNCSYEAFDSLAKQKCEHISFHDCIRRNGGKIFINPKFQNADGILN